jgi:integrase
MASVFKKSRDRANKLASWYIAYQDEDGRRRTVKGCPDKAATESLARKLESDADLKRRGVIDPKAEAYAAHEAKPLADHLDAWGRSLEAEGATPKHVELVLSRARRIVALMRGATLAEIFPVTRKRSSDVARAREALGRWLAPARLSDLTAERVQKALRALKDAGWALGTCNHYRDAIRAFVKWGWDTHRLREDPLRGVKGYNAKTDRRHDRRTISVEELRHLIETAEHGSVVLGVAGPTRALCYRLAVATGLRFSEIQSITPESFDWEAKSVRVEAACTKNGQIAELPLPSDLVADLRPVVATLPAGSPVFPLPDERGARMLRADLQAAGIPYRDAAGLFFDFHSLRCEMATLADAAGVSPRVVQRLMRHSTLALTDKYTRPRAVDIEAAASQLPSLRPETTRPESLAATGTDPRPSAAHAPPVEDDDHNIKGDNDLEIETSTNLRGHPPPSPRPRPARPAGEGVRRLRVCSSSAI